MEHPMNHLVILSKNDREGFIAVIYEFIQN